MNILPTVLYVIALYLGITFVWYVYKLVTVAPERKHPYKRLVIRRSIALFILIVIYVLVAIFSSFSGARIRGVSSGSPSASYQSAPSPFGITKPYNQPERSDISDTREFLKKSFSSTLLTRNTPAVARKVELLIKGSEGRIDTSNVATTNAYFVFVIPKSELDTFRDELQTYTHAKLYTESISTQNLLSEKQNLERSQTTANNSITNLTIEQQKVRTNYTTQAATLNTQIKVATQALVEIKTTLKSTPPQSSTYGALKSQEQSLSTQVETLKNSLASATTTFKRTMSNLGVSLSDQQTVLASLAVQEDDFFDTIETVQGSISIRTISLWDMAVKLSPIHPIFIIAILLALINIISVTRKQKQIII